VEDALSAARAAQEEGIVAGGEISRLNAMPKLDKMLKSSEEDDETRVGINIVRKALEAPIRRLAANAGQDGSVIIDTIRRTATEQKNKNIGFNVLTGKYTDMIEDGVIDPVKVVRGALENASSIAAMILTTDVLVTECPRRTSPHLRRCRSTRPSVHTSEGTSGRLRPATPRSLARRLSPLGEPDVVHSGTTRRALDFADPLRRGAEANGRPSPASPNGRENDCDKLCDVWKARPSIPALCTSNQLARDHRHTTA
jgi:hypothetical protein